MSDVIVGAVVSVVVAGIIGATWRWGRRVWRWILAKICPADPTAAIVAERRLEREHAMTDVCVLWRRLDEPTVVQLANGKTRTRTHADDPAATVACEFRRPSAPRLDSFMSAATVALPVGTVLEAGWEITVQNERRLVYAVTEPGPRSLEILAQVYASPLEWPADNTH